MAPLGLTLAAADPIPQRRQAAAPTQPPPQDPHWSSALAGITNYTAHRLGQPAPSWTRRIKPLDAAWTPAESYRSIRTSMKELTRTETPPELAALNVFIRERSLASA